MLHDGEGEREVEIDAAARVEP